MPSFSLRQARSLSDQAARHRQSLFGDGAGTAGVPNFQLGAVKFCAPISKLATPVMLRTHGKTLSYTAVILVAKSLGLAIDESSLFTHLPTGAVYEVGQIGIDLEPNAEIRVLVRRQDP